MIVFLRNLASEYFIEYISNLNPKNSLEKNISIALSRVNGTYGLVLYNLETPDLVYVIKKSSPIVIGLLEDKIYINKEFSYTKVKKVIEYLNKSHEIHIGSNLQKFISTKEENEKQRKLKHETLQNFKNGLIDIEKYNVDFKKILESLHQPLRKHQIKASYHMHLSESSALFSVPGSGKTRCVLMHYKLLLEKNIVDKLFVIGPVSSHDSWISEYSEFFDDYPNYSCFVGGHSTYRKAKYSESNDSSIILTSYHTFSNDKDYVINFLKRYRVLMVLDEAHYIKGLNKTWSNAILGLAKYSPVRVALTGTPMPQKYKDLYNIFNFISPDDEIFSLTDQIELDKAEKKENFDFIRSRVNERINPLFYRVRKSELGLKDQIKTEVFVDMNTNERLIYDSVKMKIINNARDDKLFHENYEYLNLLKKGRMIRLRQIYSNVALLNSTIKNYDEDLLADSNDLKSIAANYSETEKPAKINILKEIVSKFHKENKKLLIWSNFIGTVELIEKTIKEEGYNVKKIIGSTPPDIEEYSNIIDTRKSIKDEFNDKNSGLLFLIANPAACAEAISLHKACENALYYDLSYNCAQYLQSLDRIHRIGASEHRNSNYIFLKYRDTDEYKIFENLEKKAENMMAIIDEDYAVYGDTFFNTDLDLEVYEDLF